MRTRSPWLSSGLLLLALGCGGSPTTPSPPAPSSPVTASLQPGPYYFFVSQGSPGTLSPVGGGSHTWICLGVGSYPTAVQVPVIVEGGAANYQARAVSGSLLVHIAVSGAGASGNVQGNADDGTGAFSLSVQSTEPASIVGTVTSDHTASGTVVGNISLMGPHGYGGCSPANWGLTPR